MLRACLASQAHPLQLTGPKKTMENVYIRSFSLGDYLVVTFTTTKSQKLFATVVVALDVDEIEVICLRNSRYSTKVFT